MSDKFYKPNLTHQQEVYLKRTVPTRRLLPFDLETFKQRLREVIAWCEPRFSMDDIEWSLRSAPIPKGYTGDDLDYDIGQVSITFDTVMAKQARAFAENPLSDWEYEGLAGGRLMLSHMRPLYDGDGKPMSEGFINWDDMPAWDTWIDLFAYKPPFTELVPVLISWMPTDMLELVNGSLLRSSNWNIAWADDYKALEEYDFCRELKAAGLYYQGPPLKL